MKCVILAALIACALCASHPLEEQYHQWAAKFDHHATARGLDCFIRNSEIIEKLNAESDDATFGFGPFADECPEQFRVRLGYKKSDKPVNATQYPTIPDARLYANTTVDWRTKGAVTNVKNQGQCGSCWAFSATANMEGQHFMAGNKLISLSNEEVTQCAKNGNAGCNGGDTHSAFTWVVNDNNGNMDSNSDYPYTSGTGRTGRCDRAKLSKSVAKFTGQYKIESNEDQMAAWVAKNGPLSICVDAAQHWQNYQGGILSNCYGTSLDHCVLIVGYSQSSAGKPYWIVKNSWGTSWGESGYIYIERGTNQCGIKEEPASAIAAKN